MTRRPTAGPSSALIREPGASEPVAPIGPREKITSELAAVALTTLYFAAWIGGLVLLKTLVLAEYGIAVHQWSLALLGALLLAKVVLVLERVPLGGWIRTRPRWLETVLRTTVYAVGVALVLLLEKAVEGRHEHGGLAPSLRSVLRHAEIHHVWANTIGLGAALLFYNVLAVIRRHLGDGGLLELFTRAGHDDPPAGTTGTESGR